MNAAVVGRDQEIRAITEALARPDVSGIVLVGRPGIGKTHLLDASLGRGEAIGFATARITGSRALADLPLSAFAPLLPGRPVGDVTDLVVLRDELRRRSADRPMLLGVDDAHLLDDASAAVVHQLVSDLTVFLIATVRSGEIPPDAVTALWKDRIVTRLAIGPLDRAGIATLAEARSGKPLAPDVADELWRRSEGNPLFATELLDAALGSGVLVASGDRLVAAGELPAPASLSELLGSKLAGLTPEERRALDLLAVGGTLDIAVVERLVDPDALVQLEAAGLVVADETPNGLELRFAHPLQAEAVSAGIGRLVARQLRRQLADTIEELGGASSDEVLRIVTLRLDSGGSSPAPMLTAAAALALQRHDHALAERLARAAFIETPTLGIANLVAQACSEQGRAQEAADALRHPLIDHAAARPGERVTAAVLEAQNRFWCLEDPETALDGLAVARATVDERHRPLIDATTAVIEAGRGRSLVALELLDADPLAADTDFGAAARLLALIARGRPDVRLSAEQIERFSAAGGWSVALGCHAFALAEAGHIGDALELALEAWERSVREHVPHGRAGWSIVVGTIEQLSGRLEAGLRWFDEAARLSNVTAASGHGHRWATGGALFCAVQAGDLDEARRRRDDLATHRIPGVSPQDLLGLRGLAWLTMHEAGVDAACERLEALARDAVAEGRLGHLVHLAVDLARLDRADRALPLLDHVVDGEAMLVDGQLLPELVAAVRAVAGRDAERLSVAADQLAASGVALLAAEAAAGAWAISQATGEDVRVVSARQRRAQELRATVSAATTPALQLAPVEVPLSRREREIAVLVAEGRTSREVAELLIIGVRTVESHLARVFTKLGISSRTELPAALGLDRRLEGAAS